MTTTSIILTFEKLKKSHYRQNDMSVILYFLIKINWEDESN